MHPTKEIVVAHQMHSSRLVRHSVLGVGAVGSAVKRLERLTNQVGGVLLFDDEDSLAPLYELAGGDQSGQARPDNDDVGVGVGVGAIAIAID
jgi:hypothetical protein